MPKYTGFTDLFYNAFLAKTDSLGNIDVFTSVFEPVAPEQQLAAYPNPVDDLLHLRLPAGMSASGSSTTYTITDAVGNTVRKARLEDSLVPGATLTVPLHELNAGWYVLRLSDGERQYWTKIIKQ